MEEEEKQPEAKPSASSSSSASSSAAAEFIVRFDPSSPLGFIEEAFEFVAERSDFRAHEATEARSFFILTDRVFGRACGPGPVHEVHTEERGAVPVQERDSFDDRRRRQLHAGRAHHCPKEELNALEADMGMQTETRGPAYLQLDEGRIWMQSLICLWRQHPAGHAAEPAGRSNAQAEDELGLPAVPRAKEITCLLDNVSVLRKKMETPAAETRCRQVYLIMKPKTLVVKVVDIDWRLKDISDWQENQTNAEESTLQFASLMIEENQPVSLTFCLSDCNRFSDIKRSDARYK
ncbi:hypothetical protein NL676_038306 [Syzygium grande]|nr:hypothetical protein NL676_038306 [Syzygium grande]